jgi:hypothetical protein
MRLQDQGAAVSAYDIEREARNLSRRIGRLWKARPFRPEAVREALTAELARAKTSGYAEAHEFQMRMRVQDALERSAPPVSRIRGEKA